MHKKRGISPLITTVLLLGLIISLATVAIIWSRSNIKTTLKGAIGFVVILIIALITYYLKKKQQEIQ
jgi:flagellin-like protein